MPKGGQMEHYIPENNTINFNLNENECVATIADGVFTFNVKANDANTLKFVKLVNNLLGCDIKAAKAIEVDSPNAELCTRKLA